MKLLALLALAACTTSNPDVVGPFTGNVHRYVVDDITLPGQGDDPYQFADDVDGNGSIDNELGSIVHFLTSQNDANPHARDMIAAGVIGSVVEIQANNLVDDPQVGVTYHGIAGAAATDLATAMGGAFTGGVLRSNRARSTLAPGAAPVVLPVFADADPARLDVRRLEIDLDPDGAGGYTAIVRGGITELSVSAATLDGIRQMLASNPGAHSAFAELLNADHDGTISDDDILFNPFLGSIEASDLEDGLISMAISVHLAPCDVGTCASGAPVDRCHDRIRDGDETDVDCGGPSCMPCGPGFACALAGDCQIDACDNHACRAPTCSDGVLDGFEREVDCGGLCAGCFGDSCTTNAECSSGLCDDLTHACVVPQP